MADEAGFDRHALRADATDELRPERREVVGDVLDARLGGLGGGLEPVPAVREHHDLVSGHEEPPGVAGDAILAVLEHEAGQISAILRSHPEVGIDTGLGHRGAQAGEPLGPSRPIRFGPAGVVGGARRRLEIGWMRQPANDVGHPLMVTGETCPRNVRQDLPLPVLRMFATCVQVWAPWVRKHRELLNSRPDRAGLAGIPPDSGLRIVPQGPETPAAAGWQVPAHPPSRFLFAPCGHPRDPLPHLLPRRIG